MRRSTTNRAQERATRKVPRKAKVHRTTKMAREAALLLEDAKREHVRLQAELDATRLERDAAVNELCAVRKTLGCMPGTATGERAKELAGAELTADERAVLSDAIRKIDPNEDMHGALLKRVDFPRTFGDAELCALVRKLQP